MMFCIIKISFEEKEEASCWSDALFNRYFMLGYRYEMLPHSSRYCETVHFECIYVT